MLRRSISQVLCLVIAFIPATYSLSVSKVKLQGYITDRPDSQSLMILDDVIRFDSGVEFKVENSTDTKTVSLEQLKQGMLIEVEGVWQGKHKFAAQKISCDAEQFDARLHGAAYLDRDPVQWEQIASGNPAELTADGELLVLDQNVLRDWKIEKSQTADATAATATSRFAGRKVVWEGIRQTDGRVALKKLELADMAPADAFQNPDKIEVARAQDPQTKIDILEFRRGKKVDGRIKLVQSEEVQKYLKELGYKLLPPSSEVTRRALEFRFFAVEDAHINAAAMPDGTILVNSGLLASVQDEASLAFVLSHEISHVLQAHHWRQVHDTRLTRILITVGAIAGSYYIGDLATFLGELGMAAVVNGYSRKIEDQADRIALQNVLDNGYDPRNAIGFFRILIEQYSNRSTSALWSSHKNSMIRGSFLAAQLIRQYPGTKLDGRIVGTVGFTKMKEDLGFVKVI
jgi:hypothetical protein